MCFYKLIVYGYPKISNIGYLVPEITENTQPYMGRVLKSVPSSKDDNLWPSFT